MFTRADVARQAVDLSKATFDNAYLTIATLQQIAEDAIVDAAATSSWLPSEVGSLLREYAGFAQRTRGDLKDTADRCHALLHHLIDRTLSTEQDPEADQAAVGKAAA